MFLLLRPFFYFLTEGVGIGEGEELTRLSKAVSNIIRGSGSIQGSNIDKTQLSKWIASSVSIMLIVYRGATQYLGGFLNVLYTQCIFTLKRVYGVHVYMRNVYWECVRMCVVHVRTQSVSMVWWCHGEMS